MSAVRFHGLPICLAFLSAIFLVETKAGTQGSCDPNGVSEAIGDRSTCTFSTTLDRDPNRVPPELPVVKCRCLDNTCSVAGDFRCHEVTHNMTVAYRVPGSSTLRNKVIQVTTACVCAVAKTRQAPGGAVRPANVPNVKNWM
ncbi:interleukin cytokine-related protein 17.1-like [Dermacentor albipictus]|uniref:interleukin cytokine-related protein 17.1-like n=1 Tax=Dermacentor albipictus TaxID=60249 RepID=UPI0038FD0E97